MNKIEKTGKAPFGGRLSIKIMVGGTCGGTTSGVEPNGKYNNNIYSI